MRIVLALGWFFPESVGGTEVYVDALGRLLAEAGHEVHIAAPLAGLGAPEHRVHDGRPVFRYPVPVLPTRAEARGEVRARGAEAFGVWLRGVAPDVVHVHSLVTGLGLHEIADARAASSALVFTNHLPSLGYVCARGTMMRWGTVVCDGRRLVDRCAACVWHVHGVPRPLAHVAARVEPLRLARGALSWPGVLGAAVATPALIERNGQRETRLLSLVDRVVVLSEWAHDVLRLNGAPEAKLMVNPLGISQRNVVMKPAPAARGTQLPVLVGFVGRFDPLKGPGLLASAIERVPPDIPIRFRFIGPASSAQEHAERRALRTRLDGDPRVEFRDGVPAADMPRVLADLDVLCAPSMGAENGPTIALEARAVGTPVIGSNVGAFPETVIDGQEGRLVPPGDVAALARVLVAIARDPGIVDRWRQGLRPVRTMTDCAADYVRLYHTVRAEPEAQPA